jgi:hypothetical protein
MATIKTDGNFNVFLNITFLYLFQRKQVSQQQNKYKKMENKLSEIGAILEM